MIRFLDTAFSENEPWLRRARTIIGCSVVLLMLVGCKTLESGSYIGVVAFNSNGTRDLTFGEDGIAMVKVGDSRGGFCAFPPGAGIGIDAQRQIVTASCLAGSFVATTVTDGGTPSKQFGRDAVVVGPARRAHGLAVRWSVNTLVTGFVAAGAATRLFDTDENRFRLVAFDVRGIDRSFGINGVVTTGFPGHTGVYAKDVVIDNAGGIVAVGAVRQGLVALARYDALGRLDPGFGTGGRVVTPLRSGWAGAEPARLAFDAAGRIVVGGHVSMPQPPDRSRNFFVARYLANGTIDATFGDGGIVTTNVPVPASAEFAHDLALYDDGRIGICGGQPAGYIDGASLIFISRYESDGRPDISLDGDGVLASDLADLRGELCIALNLPPDTRNGMLVTGYAGRSPSLTLFLARYVSSGRLDATYGRAGIAKLTASDVCEAFDCVDGLRLLEGGSINTVLRGGKSYTSFAFRL